MSDSTEEVLLVRHEGPIAIMTLNNPKRLNAFNWAMRQGMYARLLEIEGMGHDVPARVWPQVLDAIEEIAHQAAPLQRQ